MTFGRFVIRLFLTVTFLSILAFLAISLFFPVARHRFIDAILRGLAFGVAFTLIVTAVDYWRRRIITRRYGLSSDYSARQERAITVSARSATVALARIEAQIPEVAWIHSRSIERDGQVIRAVTQPSWWSFAEEISLSVEDAGPGLVKVSIVSRPRSRGTIVDYGRAIENVEKLKRDIAEWLR
jgi:hypothetical protein